MAWGVVVGEGAVGLAGGGYGGGVGLACAIGVPGEPVWAPKSSTNTAPNAVTVTKAKIAFTRLGIRSMVSPPKQADEGARRLSTR